MLIRERHDAERTLPTIAISGGGQHLAPEAVLRLARCFGAGDALQKPFALGALIAAVRNALDPAGIAPLADR